MSQRISLIVAVSENGVIGRAGEIPWRLSADLRAFKRLTMGHHIIMGRRTFDSLGRLLPGRTSVVISRQSDLQIDGAIVTADLYEALEATGDDEEVFVIGGAEIYRLAIPLADCIYLTRVHAHIEGDTRLPEWDWSEWQLVQETRHAADEKNEHDYSFLEYRRARPR